MERVGWGRGVVSAVELIDKKLEKKIHRGTGGNKKLSLFFVSYVGINIKKFAVGISCWSYFLE